MTIKPPRLRETSMGLEDTTIRSVQRMPNIPKLPVELVSHIFNHLETPELIQCTLACKFFHKLISETSRLLYTKELSKSRMVSILPSSASPNYASRLELLRNREQAWRVLGYKHRQLLNLPKTGSLYEFVGGVYGNGREGMTTSISFLELPSTGVPVPKPEDIEKLRKHPQQLLTWTHTMPDLSIIDFTMDPMQDLLVLVAVAPATSQYVYELHIRSIKTNQPHSKAPVAVFPCLRKPDNHLTPFEIITAVRVQVCGNLVALLIKDVMENSGGHLEIWNWESGPQYTCTMPRTQGIDDFSFLTQSVALIVRPTGQFEVYDFKDPRLGPSEPILRYSFGFPPLSQGYNYWYISMSNNPTPGYVPSDNAMEGFLKGHPQIYYPDPAERIHACCLYVFNPADPVMHAVSSFVFFVKIDSLLNPPLEWFESDDDDGPRPYCHPSVFPGRRRGEDTEQQLSRETTPSDIDLPISNFPHLSPPSSTPINPLFSGPSTSSAQSASSNLPPSTASPMTLEELRTKYPPVPWEVWGPSSTRWFEECLSTDWQHAIYGLRAVESVEVSKMAAERQFPIHTWPTGRQADEDEGRDDTDTASTAASQGVQTFIGSGAAASTSTGVGTASTTTTAGVHGTQNPPVPPLATGGAGGGAGMVGGAAPANAGTQPQNLAALAGALAAPARRERRFLRLRDFNPYAQTKAARLETRDHAVFKGKGKIRSLWRAPKVVKEMSRVNTGGVFKYDIMSSLPYVETVSDETFDVTDVMMDDSRLLLLTRGTAGRLQQLEVLML